MIRYVLYRLDNGLVEQAGQAASADTIPARAGCASLVVASDVDWQTARVVDGVVVTIPPRPSAAHEWQGGSWVDTTPLAALKARKHDAIDAERERRNNLPIDFGPSTFDADAVAQRNVSAWMVNIAAGVAPPPGFVWRDHFNVNHTADSTFVVGLGAAITVRGTLLYQTAWTKKAEIDALTSAQAVRDYDVLAGW